MQRSTYVRPIGLFPAPANAAEDAWSGLPLAGQPLRFTAIDLAVPGSDHNFAVAYEHEGQLAKARAAYDKALALQPNNALVRQNYDLFKEINDRAAQKDGRS